METMVPARPTLTRLGAIAAAALLLAVPLAPQLAGAASHREAPLISLDPTADITDFFMFRGYESGKSDKVVFIMNVLPGEDPSSGPNYYNFDPTVRYAFNIDNDGDGRADDLVFEFQFKTELRGTCKSLGLPLALVALPPIDSLSSDGLCQRQSFDLTMSGGKKDALLGDDRLVVPSSVGPRTTPDYQDLAADGVHALSNGVRVFAGQRQDPFYIDLGAVFDTLNTRRTPPILTAGEDASDQNSFGVNTLAGFNVQTIALEVPITLLTKDGKGAGDTTQSKLGAYASTSRRATTVLRGGSVTSKGKWVQVQRLANPLVNELIIGTDQKDRWNSLDPDQESQFLDFYLNSRLAVALETVFNVGANKTNRTDLRDLLLKYKPSDTQLSELLRLDLSMAPKSLNQQNRLTVLGGDNAGWPNGRRPKDDVTDVALRVVGGPNYARAGDGVNSDDADLLDKFPYLGTPSDGRGRQFENP
jgi:uncharacterized protein DUF4331